MSDQREARYRIHTYMTKTRWLHIEDATAIGKVRLFAGQYQRGKGAEATAYHFLDIKTARALFSDLAWGKRVGFKEFKGIANGKDGKPISRVLQVKTNGGKVWFGLQNGPGEVIGEGAVKPAGKPDAEVNVPLTTWAARELGFAVLAHLAAWEAATFSIHMESEAQDGSVRD